MRIALAILIGFVAQASWAIDAIDSFRSPRNPERKVRASTELIVLHTTEAPARSSINKVSDRGECHFVVTEVGRVYRIVDRDREAFHAGRSMWGGKEDVDKFSIGIECVGYHNKAMPRPQLAAIKSLVKELQAMYGIPDERVVAHSHVAYGAPNRWQKRRHRGRKRCGMLFAMASVRRQLGLTRRPAYDPDTRARRLTVGDPYLHQVLYSHVDTMASTYGGVSAPKAIAAAPSYRSRTQSAKAPKSSFRPQSVRELKAAGYSPRGTVTKANTALKIAGGRWNAPDTFYVIRGKVLPGTAIDARHIELGMVVWMRGR